MINLRLLLGLFPSTEKLEAKRSFLENEYQEYKKFENSPELKEYNELHELINSPEFKRRIEEIKRLNYKYSEAYSKEQSYNKLLKNEDVKNYLKIIDSKKYEDFKYFEKSGEYQQLLKLEEKINEDPSNVDIRKQYKSLLSNKWIKNNLKFRDSIEYKRFLQFINSTKYEQFKELKKYIDSEEFIKTKEYLSLSPKKRFKASDEYQKILRYEELSKSPKIKWYLKLKKSNKFNEIENKELTFYEDFKDNKIDKKVWLTRYYWGEKLLNDSYSLDLEKNYYSENNLKISNSVLSIITKQEKAKGKIWKPSIGNLPVGFIERDFNYTSGIINTGDSFRQQYGIFEAKIKFENNFCVTQAFSLVGDFMLPQIDVVRANKKLIMGNYWNNGNNVSKNLFKRCLNKFKKDFYIYTVEWYPDKIVWKINEIEVARTSSGVPNIPLYLLLNSSIIKEVKNSFYDCAMKIDWIKCYKLKNLD